MKGFFTTHPWLKAASFLLAAVLFYFVNALDVESRSYRLDVEVRDVPEGWRVLDDPGDVTLVVEGTRTVLRRLDADALRVLPIGPLRSGDNEWEVREADLRLPDGISVVSIEPSRISVRMEEMVTREVRIALHVTGAPAPGYSVSSRTIEPTSIVITAPASYFPELDEIDTEVVDISGRNSNWQGSVELNPVRPYISWNRDVTLTASIEVTAEVTQRSIDGVPVNLTGADANRCEMRDTTLYLEVSGPRALVDLLDTSTVYGAVDCSALVAQGPGLYPVQPEIRNLREGLSLVESVPQEVRVRVLPQPPELPNDVAPDAPVAP